MLLSVSGENQECSRCAALRGCARPVPQRRDQRPDSGDDLRLSLVQLGGEDVLAVRLPPDVVAAVAARVVGGEQIHPMLRLATAHSITPAAYALAHQLDPALEAAQIDRFIRSHHAKSPARRTPTGFGRPPENPVRNIPENNPKVASEMGVSGGFWRSWSPVCNDRWGCS